MPTRVSRSTPSLPPEMGSAQSVKKKIFYEQQYQPLKTIYKIVAPAIESQRAHLETFIDSTRSQKVDKPYKAFLQKNRELAKITLKAIEILEKAYAAGPSPKSEDQREAFLDTLRKAIKLEKKLESLELFNPNFLKYNPIICRNLLITKNLIHIMSATHFDSTQLRKCDKRAAKTAAIYGQLHRSDSFSTRLEKLQKGYKSWKKAASTSWGTICFRFNSGTGIGYNPSNRMVATKVCDLEIDGRRIHYIRTPSATITPWFESPQIDPLFEVYLDTTASDKDQPDHIYFNLQKRKDAFNKGGSLIGKLTLNAESKRVTCLEAIAEKKSNFHVVTLAHNGKFYDQEGEVFGKASMKYQEFKDAFIDNLLNSKYGFHIASKKVRTLLTEKRLSRLLRRVHHRFFNSKSALTQQERRDFIDLAYNAIIIDILRKVKPASFNTSCKSDKDRGGLRRTLLLAQLTLSSPRLSSNKKRDLLHKIAAHLGANAFRSSESPMKGKFFERALHMARVLESKATNFKSHRFKILYGKKTSPEHNCRTRKTHVTTSSRHKRSPALRASHTASHRRHLRSKG